MTTKGNEVRRAMSRFTEPARTADSLDFSSIGPGQNCPTQKPQPAESKRVDGNDSLGQPMTIGHVAAMLGCSVWTVRQRYLPQGLPHFRSCAAGKLVFFRSQVIAWILKRQLEKGGRR
jgi:hypothetical protein